MSYKLISLRIAFIARVTSYFYCTTYELLFSYELRVTIYCTSYFLHMNCGLLFTARVTSQFLTMSHNKDRDNKVAYDDKVMINNYSLRSFFDKELMFR